MLASHLPIRVELEPDAPYFASHLHPDLLRLVDRIQKLDRQDLCEFIAAINTAGTMFPSWWVRKSMSFIKWRHGMDDLNAWNAVLRRPSADKMLKSMRKDTINHIMNGRDREEKRSVGGWSQREINFASNYLNMLDRRQEAGSVA